MFNKQVKLEIIKFAKLQSPNSSNGFKSTLSLINYECEVLNNMITFYKHNALSPLLSNINSTFSAILQFISVKTIYFIFRSL